MPRLNVALRYTTRASFILFKTRIQNTFIFKTLSLQIISIEDNLIIHI